MLVEPTFTTALALPVDLSCQLEHVLFELSVNPHAVGPQALQDRAHRVELAGVLGLQEDSERTRVCKSGERRDAPRQAIIEKHEAARVRETECDDLALSGAEVDNGGEEGAVGDLEESDPVDGREGWDSVTEVCARRQLGNYRWRNDEAAVQLSEKVKVTGAMQIEERARVGDDEPLLVRHPPGPAEALPR